MRTVWVIVLLVVAVLAAGVVAWSPSLESVSAALFAHLFSLYLIMSFRPGRRRDMSWSSGIGSVRGATRARQGAREVATSLTHLAAGADVSDSMPPRLAAIP